MTTFVRRQERRDTAANWASANPILAAGEWGFDTTNNISKMGDGVTAWSSLGRTALNVGSGTNAVALGTSSTASGVEAIAVGLGSLASGQDATAVGTVCGASGNFSAAYGYGATASGASGIAIGNGATSTGSVSVSIGAASDASNNATALGNDASASGDTSLALGYGSGATASASIAIGYAVQATHAGSVAIGAKSDFSASAATSATNQIVLGTSSHIVVVPGNASISSGSGSVGFFGATPVTKRSGWTAATGTATRTTFATSTVTTSVLAEHVKALIDDLLALGVITT